MPHDPKRLNREIAAERTVTMPAVNIENQTCRECQKRIYVPATGESPLATGMVAMRWNRGDDTDYHDGYICDGCAWIASMETNPEAPLRGGTSYAHGCPPVFHYQ